MVSWLKEESVEDVVWIKADTKGYKIAGSGRQHSLILMDVGAEYAGAYTCIATNRAGQSLCSARLEVDEGEAQGERTCSGLSMLVFLPSQYVTGWDSVQMFEIVSTLF